MLLSGLKNELTADNQESCLLKKICNYLIVNNEFSLLHWHINRNFYISLQHKRKAMVRNSVIDSIKQVASKVLPKGSVLYLYGSRARGDYRDDSDWDMLLLLDKPQKDADDFDKYAYPIMECGFDLWQYFSVQTYTKNDWYNGRHAMFFHNVERDKQLLYES
jgi:predicted nucleotidyltransferase